MNTDDLIRETSNGKLKVLEDKVYNLLIERGAIDSKENFLQWRKSYGANKRMPQRYSFWKDIKAYGKYLKQKNINLKGNETT